MLRNSANQIRLRRRSGPAALLCARPRPLNHVTVTSLRRLILPVAARRTFIFIATFEMFLLCSAWLVVAVWKLTSLNNSFCTNNVQIGQILTYKGSLLVLQQGHRTGSALSTSTTKRFPVPNSKQRPKTAQKLLGSIFS